MNQWDLDLDMSLPCGVDPVAHTHLGTAMGSLEIKLAAREVTNDDVLYLAGCSLDTHPGKSNWVEDAGGLPEYICKVARSIHAKRGKSISNAIQIAIGVVRNWSRGQGDVDADTRAKAAAAVAEWNALKAKAKATPNK